VCVIPATTAAGAAAAATAAATAATSTTAVTTGRGGVVVFDGDDDDDGGGSSSTPHRIGARVRLLPGCATRSSAAGAWARAAAAGDPMGDVGNARKPEQATPVSVLVGHWARHHAHRTAVVYVGARRRRRSLVPLYCFFSRRPTLIADASCCLRRRRRRPRRRLNGGRPVFPQAATKRIPRLRRRGLRTDLYFIGTS